MKVGSQAFLFPFGADLSQRITLNVVGIVDAIDPNEEYWMGIPFYFRVQEFDGKPLVPFYIPEQDFFGGLGAQFPTLVGDYGWFSLPGTPACSRPQRCKQARGTPSGAWKPT